MLHEMSPEDLTREIQTVRDFGWVVCDWRARACQGAPSDEELDAYAETVGLSAMGEATSPQKGGWRETTATESRSILSHRARHSLAYGEETVPSAGTSAELIEPFFEAFAVTGRFFTNVAETGEWWPKTRHTFDSGVIVVDTKTIGLVWFAEED